MNDKKDKLISIMVNREFQRDNQTDIDAYTRGLIDMYDILMDGYNASLVKKYIENKSNK